MTRTLIALVLLAVLGACTRQPDRSAPRPTAGRDPHIAAADAFTKRYAQSRLEGWHVRGRAAGPPDCTVLFVETSLIMEDSMIEAMQYGAGAYDMVQGGVERFCRDKAFRGAVYRDPSGRIWRYGHVTRDEAESVQPCQ